MTGSARRLKYLPVCENKTENSCDTDCLVDEPGHNHLASPGDVVTSDQSCVHRHGIYTDQDVLFANAAGMVEKVNKLISVTPVTTR